MGLKGTTQKVARWKPWIQVALVAVSGGSPLLARTPARVPKGGSESRGQPKGHRESGLIITLRIYNYAQVAPAELTLAEQVAADIFRKAGIEPAWVDCPLSPAEGARYPACLLKMRTTDFVLRVMTAPMAAKLPTTDGALGFAPRCPDHERGCLANILYPRVDELASLHGARAARILGHVVAHEVGHLLLGPNPHSPRGVMRGVWSPDDLKFMDWNSLFFTRRQSAQMRAHLARRANLEPYPDLEPGSGQL